MRRITSPLEWLNIALIGVASRGGSFAAAFAAHPRTRIHAVCDVRGELLDEARAKTGAAEAYTDYDEMLERSDVDAVVIGTPMQFHVPQAIAALRRQLHVLSEVTAGVSIDEVPGAGAGRCGLAGVYMMAENYTYMKPNVSGAGDGAARASSATPYYAEGEYIHELKALNEVTHLAATTGRPASTASPTARTAWGRSCSGCPATGSCASAAPGAATTTATRAASSTRTRIAASCCARRRAAALIKIRVDMLSDRPHAMTNYQLQGTKGCYESARAPGRAQPGLAGAIWPRTPNAWIDLAGFEAEFLPEIWRHPPQEALAGRATVAATTSRSWTSWTRIGAASRRPIGIHEAMDMTLPGLVSQESIRAGGAWLDVPDSRAWVTE